MPSNGRGFQQHGQVSCRWIIFVRRLYMLEQPYDLRTRTKEKKRFGPIYTRSDGT